MPYIKETVIAGKTIEVYKRFSSRYNKKGIPRGANVSPTAEAVKKINEKNAEDKLRQLINTNFGYMDIHLVLTYKKELRPDAEQAKKDLAKFIRKLRLVYKKNGRELKYISVTEYKNKAIHHHLIINSIDMRDVVPLWEFGRARPTYLDETGQYGKLASYLIKETSKTYKTEKSASGKRWNASKNLIKPKVIKEIISANSWRDEPKPLKGYYIEKDSVVSGIHEISGYMFQRYCMIRLE